LLRNGDVITTQALTGELSVAVSDADLAARKADWKGPRKTAFTSGAVHEFALVVGGARWGAVTHPWAMGESHVCMDQQALGWRPCAGACFGCLLRDQPGCWSCI